MRFICKCKRRQTSASIWPVRYCETPAARHQLTVRENAGGNGKVVHQTTTSGTILIAKHREVREEAKTRELYDGRLTGHRRRGDSSRRPPRRTAFCIRHIKIHRKQTRIANAEWKDADHYGASVPQDCGCRYTQICASVCNIAYNRSRNVMASVVVCAELNSWQQAGRFATKVLGDAGVKKF